mmetsp:Transcript_72158/g.181881  ORF Transcript_72158/g.181881 Transcript_72158/m.181881 type:complete len:226 (-) Transcript_72158:248-925(-)
MSTHSTVYTHRQIGDLLVRERHVRETHCTRADDAACNVYGTPRRNYRPVLGVSGTLQSTPNPCLERDRHRALPHEEATSTPRKAVVPGELLPSLGVQKRGVLPDRTAEADLTWGVPPHQVHHHNFGWTMSGPKTPATVFSARRPWGIGLTYSNDIASVVKKFRDCPSARASSAHAVAGSQAAGSKHSMYSPGDMMMGKTSLQASSAQLSTAAPSDANTFADMGDF